MKSKSLIRRSDADAEKAALAVIEAAKLTPEQEQEIRKRLTPEVLKYIAAKGLEQQLYDKAIATKIAQIKEAERVIRQTDAFRSKSQAKRDLKALREHSRAARQKAEGAFESVTAGVSNKRDTEKLAGLLPLLIADGKDGAQ